MNISFLTMPHVVFGVWGVIMTVWLLVEVLNASEKNLRRMKISSALSAVFNWLAYIWGGWWYVKFYGLDKAKILKGPFPSAHGIFMETKEHVFFILLILATFLPIIIYNNNNLSENKNARKLAIVVATLMIILGFGMEGAGSFITQGLRLGLGGK